MQRGRGREDAGRGAGIATPGDLGATGIVAAGGRGERASAYSSIPKQFRPLAGKPLVLWSVEMLLRSGCSRVLVAVPPGSATDLDLGIAADLSFVDGGDSRSRSVRNALAEVSTPRVVITDAARPLATVAMTRAALASLETHDGAIVAVPLADTLKEVEGDSVVGTRDRSGLYRAQTPQAFKTDVLASAHARAEAEGFEATDDAELLERYGGSVCVVEGAEANIKITYEHDFEVAEALMRTR